MRRKQETIRKISVDDFISDLEREARLGDARAATMMKGIRAEQGKLAPNARHSDGPQR